MVENSSSLSSVSKQIFTDLRSAYCSYDENNQLNSTDDKAKTYKNNGQITRKALNDINNNIVIKAKEENFEVEDQEDSEAVGNNNVPTQQSSNIDNKATNSEITKISLPKNNQTIVAELKRNGLNKTLSYYDIAKKYNISYMKAREILDELNKDSNGFVREYKLPENSTISYKV